MSAVKLVYGDLTAAGKKAGAAANELDDYSNSLSTAVLNKISVLPGSDAKGYMSTVTSLLQQKQKALAAKKEPLLQFQKDANALVSSAEQADNLVAKKIKSLAKSYEKKQPWWQKVKSCVHNFFCGKVADFISNYLPFGDAIIDGLRNDVNWISHGVEKIQDWFNYGDGTYYKELIKSITGFVGAAVAIIGVVAAGVITLFPPLSIVLTVVAIAAGTIYALTKLVDMYAASESFLDANRARRNGQTGLARYYAGTTGVSDYIEKHDMGSAKANKNYETFGKGYDTVGKAAKIIFTVCSLALSVMGLGVATTVVNGQSIYTKDFSNGNVYKNLFKFEPKIKLLSDDNVTRQKSQINLVTTIFNYAMNENEDRDHIKAAVESNAPSGSDEALQIEVDFFDSILNKLEKLPVLGKWVGFCHDGFSVGYETGKILKESNVADCGSW